MYSYGDFTKPSSVVVHYPDEVFATPIFDFSYFVQ
jgi:hypothetical protein